MAPKRTKSLAEQLADLENPAPKDFDPEEEPIPDTESEDGSAEGEDNEEAARGHYENVSKSKLRKPQEVSLGPQYAGSRVSRDAMLDDEDEDDPFSKGFDEGDSEEDEEEGEEDGRGVDVDGQSSDEVADSDDVLKDQDLLGGEETPASDVSDEEEDDSERPPMRKDMDEDRAELRRLMAQEQKSVAATLSEAARADAEKGRAVKRQRQTFDALLNTRIKLQKALIGTNNLAWLAQSSNKTEDDSSSESAFGAAETAAFTLWHSLTSLRQCLDATRTGQKRKRDTFTVDTPTSELWSYTRGQGNASQSNRDSILEKWSAKTRGASSIAPRNRLNPTASSHPSITDSLSSTLATSSDRLVKRTHTPRSCAPLHVSRKVAEDEHIYDDADFYGTLLQSLLEQRNSDLAQNINFDIGSGYQMRREAKTKKDVDTKASKGRKLKYTVHEKLQNFMAPEDRGTWGERQMDELFGSLFGRRMVLDENEDSDGVDEVETEGALADEEALMLFRS